MPWRIGANISISVGVFPLPRSKSVSDRGEDRAHALALCGTSPTDRATHSDRAVFVAALLVVEV